MKMLSLSPKQMAKALVEEHVAGSMDEAAHMLVDMGEINSTEHMELLSPTERARLEA